MVANDEKATMKNRPTTININIEYTEPEVKVEDKSEENIDNSKGDEDAIVESELEEEANPEKAGEETEVAEISC